MKLKDLSLPFKEAEIEWRLQSCGKKANGQIWATCLAYVSARAIMNRLDDVCGPENWRVKYSFPPQKGIISEISIQIRHNEWVGKEDGAEETEIESFKGGLSSALKRAGAVWGIGRYLYNLETGFANIVQQGGLYGKTKDGAEFRWTPPHLPQWALPEDEKAQPNGAKPEQPEKGDGIQEEGVLIKYGPLAGQLAHNADPKRLRAYLLDEGSKWIKRGLDVPPNWAQDLVESAEALCVVTKAEIFDGNVTS